MNLEKERELFKQAYINSRSEDNIPFPDVVFDEYLRLRAQDGYKVVPVEMPDSVLDDLHYGGYSWGELDDTKSYFEPVYKAMIGAVE